MKRQLRDRTQWHAVFAWLPVHIDGVSVWLERVERRCYFSHMWGDEYEYRIPVPQPDIPS
jgi:hypothetical protein